MIFDKDRLHKLHAAAGFTVWFYDAATGQDANGAAYALGYFPEGSVSPGDAVYIRNALNKQTTHHCVDWNTHENKLCLRLFGG